MDHEGFEERNPRDESRLETIAYRSGVHPDELREWLRSEIDRRLRQLAKREPVEVNCRNCGDTVDVSPGQAEQIASGRRRAPLCPDCKWPERAAQENAHAVAWVELKTGSAEEIEAAIAALSS